MESRPLNSSEDVAQHYFKQAVAEMMENTGFSSCQESVLNYVMDIGRRYMEKLWTTAKDYAELAGRVQPTFEDANMVFKTLHFSVSELHNYMQQVACHPLPKLVPHFPAVILDKKPLYEKASEEELLARPDHIPHYLPTLYPKQHVEKIIPTDDSASKTSARDKRMKSARKPKIKLSLPDYSGASAKALGFERPAKKATAKDDRQVLEPSGISSSANVSSKKSPSTTSTKNRKSRSKKISMQENSENSVPQLSSVSPQDVKTVQTKEIKSEFSPLSLMASDSPSSGCDSPITRAERMFGRPPSAVVHVGDINEMKKKRKEKFIASDKSKEKRERHREKEKNKNRKKLKESSSNDSAIGISSIECNANKDADLQPTCQNEPEKTSNEDSSAVQNMPSDSPPKTKEIVNNSEQSNAGGIPLSVYVFDDEQTIPYSGNMGVISDETIEMTGVSSPKLVTFTEEPVKTTTVKNEVAGTEKNSVPPEIRILSNANTDIHPQTSKNESVEGKAEVHHDITDAPTESKTFEALSVDVKTFDSSSLADVASSPNADNVIATPSVSRDSLKSLKMVLTRPDGQKNFVAISPVTSYELDRPKVKAVSDSTPSTESMEKKKKHKKNKDRKRRHSKERKERKDKHDKECRSEKHKIGDELRAETSPKVPKLKIRIGNGSASVEASPTSTLVTPSPAVSALTISSVSTVSSKISETIIEAVSIEKKVTLVEKNKGSGEEMLNVNSCGNTTKLSKSRKRPFPVTKAELKVIPKLRKKDCSPGRETIKKQDGAIPSISFSANSKTKRNEPKKNLRMELLKNLTKDKNRSVPIKAPEKQAKSIMAIKNTCSSATVKPSNAKPEKSKAVGGNGRSSLSCNSQISKSVKPAPSDAMKITGRDLKCGNKHISSKHDIKKSMVAKKCDYKSNNIEKNRCEKIKVPSGSKERNKAGFSGEIKMEPTVKDDLGAINGKNADQLTEKVNDKTVMTKEKPVKACKEKKKTEENEQLKKEPCSTINEDSILNEVSQSSLIVPTKIELPEGSEERASIADSDDSLDTMWICPECSVAYVEGATDMVGCDACDNWFHWSCVGLVVAPPDDVPWYCNNCARKKQKKSGNPKVSGSKKIKK